VVLARASVRVTSTNPMLESVDVLMMAAVGIPATDLT